jgi:hypothetical protein
LWSKAQPKNALVNPPPNLEMIATCAAQFARANPHNSILQFML